ncbi:MAG: hypothetical protein D3910_27385 [Candidatus Electrothrix sp. ATG2]|nr:hypothetical protein [Candidatus Electrothrix sp. ATG2]
MGAEAFIPLPCSLQTISVAFPWVDGNVLVLLLTGLTAGRENVSHSKRHMKYGEKRPGGCQKK